MALDMDKLNAFVGQFVGDLGAAVHSGMVVIGEKLGLYKALAEGAMTSAELAAKTRTDERYVREWLSSQAAGGYVTYNEQTRKFSLSEEQAFTLANEDSPAYLPGAFQLALALSPQFPGLPRRSDPAQAWVGMNTMKMCFMAARNSFGRAMRQTSSVLGFLRCTACRLSSRPGRASPMLGAARARPPC